MVSRTVAHDDPTTRRYTKNAAAKKLSFLRRLIRLATFIRFLYGFG